MFFITNSSAGVISAVCKVVFPGYVNVMDLYLCNLFWCVYDYLAGF